MLFSFYKLKQLANLPDSVKVEDVAKAINSIGFEVEEYNKFTDVEGVKFGRILEIKKNPEADKLSVCRIAFDDKERTIQTNATNVFEGMTVIAFVPGSRMGEMTFAAKELKGIISEGMLSAPSEFGINKDLLRPEMYEGIMNYSDVSDLSLDPIKYLELDDYIIDVTILSNRSDANSYYVMALELAAYFGTSVELPSIKAGNLQSNISVENGDAKNLTMIEAKNDFNISIQEQLFLAKHGVKSFNNIIDLTNLTLLMTGQPTHAYDKKLVGSSFKVGKYTGQVNVFGNKPVKLENDIVIFADGKPASVGGVIGLEETGVQNDTQEFILQLARFNIKEVRKAVKSVKLNTDASSQSSKESALGTIELAIAYISNKLGTFSNAINYEEPIAKKVSFSEEITSALAGYDLTKDPKYTATLESLSKLGFKFKGSEVEVPTYRHDVEAQQDLNEEIFRFYGYDNFKPMAPKVASFKVENIRTVAQEVAAMGYQEVVTYSLISEKTNVVNPFGFDKSIKLETFISKEREIIRDSQALSLLEVIEHNQKRKIMDISIFDQGMINDGIKTLALASTVKTFDEIKRDLVSIISPKIEFERLSLNELHPGVSAKIMLNNKMIGWIGKVHPTIANVDAFVAEVILPKTSSKMQFVSYDESPLKTRDITFEITEKEELENKVAEIKTKNIFDIKVIDEFKQGDILKSTVRITAEEKTIEEIDNQYN